MQTVMRFSKSNGQNGNKKVLEIRYFRQCARKNNENFGKKREGWTVPALLTRKNTRIFIMIKL